MKRFMIKNSPATLLEDDVDYSIPAHSNLDQVCEAFTLFLKASYLAAFLIRMRNLWSSDYK